MENEMGYIVAKGPEGLDEVLSDLLDKSKIDPIMKAKPHYILYELGNQKSLVKMDMSDWPILFWYYDLLGRPATSVVKDAIARFLWEKAGEREWYLKEKVAQEKQEAYAQWYNDVFDGKNSREG